MKHFGFVSTCLGATVCVIPEATSDNTEAAKASETLVAVLNSAQKLLKNPFADGKYWKIGNIGNLGIDIQV